MHHDVAMWPRVLPVLSTPPLDHRPLERGPSADVNGTDMPGGQQHQSPTHHADPRFQIPDPKRIQVALIGFMDKYAAAAFMDELWKLLLSAQGTVGGVPAEFIEAKKKELEAARSGGGGGGDLEGQMRARAGAMDSGRGGVSEAGAAPGLELTINPGRPQRIPR